MNPNRNQGVTLRQAALIAGVAMLIMSGAAPVANFLVFSKLIYPGNIELTIQNLTANRALFLTGIFDNLITYICDLVLAWAFYVLLAPVNRSLSLLAAWFRLMYTAIAFFSLLKVVTVFRLLNTSNFQSMFGADQLHAQVKLLLDSSRYDSSFGLLLFGIYVALLGFLIYRSGYIPKILGVVLMINGSGWLIDSLGPYLYPGYDVPFLSVTFYGELILMLWLLVRGWKIQDQN